MAYERRIKVTDTLNDAYLFYKKNTKDPMSEREFKEIAYGLNKIISDLIITESFEYRIPHGLGFLRIKKGKMKLSIRNGRLDINKNIIDWKETWDYWEEQYPGLSRNEIKKIEGKKVVFQTNDHTNGEVMRWYWDKRTSKTKNISAYMFKPVKGGFIDNKYLGRLGLASWINSDEKENDYYF